MQLVYFSTSSKEKNYINIISFLKYSHDVFSYIKVAVYLLISIIINIKWLNLRFFSKVQRLNLDNWKYIETNMESLNV